MNRKKFEKYIKRYTEKASLINTNLAVLQELFDPKSDNLFKVSINFFNATMYNTFANSVVMICSFFAKSDEACLNKFLEFCDQNKELFKQDFFNGEADMDFLERLEESKKLIEESEKIIKKLKDNRDNLYAHFSKKGFFNNEKVQVVFTTELIALMEIVDKVINNMYVMFDGVMIRFEVINAKDVNNLSRCINLYIKHKHEIIKVENNTKKSSID